MSQLAAKKMPAKGVHSPSALESENAHLRTRVAELERLVLTDCLTSLFNRRHFIEELDRCCWRAHRYGGTYGLLFFDVDRMKAVNDIQGHRIGDDVLRGVAKALTGAVRKSDIAARIGGDEFTILLDCISAEKLAQKTASMQASLAALLINTEGPKLTIGVSVGSCQIESGARAADVLDAADKAMYAHKRSKYPA